MSRGLLELLARGGPWAQVLFFGAMVWVLVLLALVVLQRRRLELQWREVAGAAAPDADAETLVRRARAALDALSGGWIGAAAVACWWLFAVAALAWNLTGGLDVGRMADEAYVASVLADRALPDVVRRYSTALIVRSMVGITGVPLACVSLLAIDQMLLRPRSRWLLCLRRRACPGRRCSRPCRAPGSLTARSPG